MFLAPITAARERYCSKPACRRASKAAARARWLQQPQNRRYFRGPEHVERVRRWRERHPGYWRNKSGKRPLALQDLAPPEPSAAEPLTDNPGGRAPGPLSASAPAGPLGGGALQDLADIQVPLLVGVVSLLLGDALQDRFAEVARHLVDRGKRVLAAEP